MKHEAYTYEEFLGGSVILHWHKVFSNGREIAALLPHIEQKMSICTKEIVNTIVAVVPEDHHITVRQLAQALDILKLSIYQYDSA